MAPPLPPAEYFTSVICEIETLSYPGLRTPETQQVRNLLSQLTVIQLTAPVKESAIQLRKSHNLRIPDAIIAATGWCFPPNWSPTTRSSSAYQV